MKKVMGIALGLIPLVANAECVPSPDCASIGYTETSCDGGSLKCPFDTSKLICVPCDSSFRFTCEGENITGGIGSSCNNKYAKCSCAAGTTFINGKCICDTSCSTIGNIYYSDGTCNSCLISDKTVIGIVAYNNGTNNFAMSINYPSMHWSADGIDVPNLYTYPTSDSAIQDFNGKTNTATIVNHYGDNASDNAAVYCYNYAPSGLEGSLHQWYLPAYGELNQINNDRNLIKNGLNVLNKGFPGNAWTSTEFSTNACTVGMSWNGTGNLAKTYYSCVVLCLLQID